MSQLTHFDFIPLGVDAETKIVAPVGLSEADKTSTSSKAMATELEALNTLHQSLLALETPKNVPPPPIPVHPKRSANVTKLRESGNAEFRKGKYDEAIKFYTLGLQMAIERPMWEPSQLVREEISALYANRAQAHMALQQWVEGSIDAEISVETKRLGNAKAWWRRGRCLLEMGRVVEAKEWVSRGLELEGDEAELVALLKDIDAKLGDTVI